MTSQTSVDKAIAQLKEKTGGRLDVLVNNVSVRPSLCSLYALVVETTKHGRLAQLPGTRV